MSYWPIPPVWSGRTVAVLASGPSISQQVADQVQHLPRIAINATYQLARDADVLYASDATFWHCATYVEVLQLPGRKVCVEQVRGIKPNLPAEVEVVRHGGLRGYSNEPGAICTGGNSGYAALHLAMKAGAARVLLLGLDMCGDHWHGRHPKGLSNPQPEKLGQWAARFSDLAQAAAERGVAVINCSPISRVECFTRSSLADALAKDEVAA